MKKVFFRNLTFFLSLLLLSSPIFAEKEIEYDPYLSILRYPETAEEQFTERRERAQFLARILEQPIRPVGYGLGKTAEWAERAHLEDKVVWFFDELAIHGIHLKTKSPTEASFGTLGLRGRIEFEKLFKIEQPYLTTEAFGGLTPNKDFAGSTVELGGRYHLEAPAGALFHEGLFRYDRSSAESFYGVGQNTSLGDLVTYQPEQLKWEGSLGYRFNPTMDGRAVLVYEKVHIGNGNRERVGKIKEYFGSAGMAGINGGDLIGFAASFIHDNSDSKSDPKRGGSESIDVSYHHDTDGTDFQFVKLVGSIRHFFPIGSDRRILALRLAGEKNQKLFGDDIPFFKMARLGGSDRSDGSELLRSYRYNRFFDEGLLTANAEYRYNIYEYGNFAGDAFLLFDVGEVFEEIETFGFEELKFSYGGGLNIKFRRKTLLSLLLARGNEGWRAAAHTKISF
ncbi:MAG: BamA/TamA family outer membrane protein [Candidatus Omnitrophica bacterium]|nr:BamA/TamA family outer membrane protein [Candidatus Omnitrophota bacterium]